MGLPQDIIMSDTRDIYSFSGNKSIPLGRIPLDITVMTKSLIVDFLIVDCNSAYNEILGRDMTIPMEAIASSRYKYVKFPYMGCIEKIWSNQWGTHQANERKIIDIDLSETNGNNILTINHISGASTMT